jgi:hypothetical protein
VGTKTLFELEMGCAMADVHLATHYAPRRSLKNIAMSNGLWHPSAKLIWNGF